MRITAALIAIAALFASACGTPVQGTNTNAGGVEPAVAAAPASTTITVTLTDNKITASSLTAPAGAITFNVTNTGTMTHELVVLKTALAEDKIPASSTEPGTVSEDGNVGETDDMDAGATKSFTVNLEPGHYVLICNEVGHYLLGMHATFTVK